MLRSIFNTFVNCFKIPELKSRIFYTLIVLAICRMMAYVIIPGLDGAKLKLYFDSLQSSGGMFGMYSAFTGGAMENCAIGALGIMPYISATIVMQLLTAVIPSLAKMAREEGGRTKIIKYSRYLTVLICLGQGFAMTKTWEHPQTLFRDFQGSLLLPGYSVLWYEFQTVLLLTIGTLLMMWLGEQITERGIGNGVSLVITIGILARLPKAWQGLVDMFRAGPNGESSFHLWNALALIALLVVVVAGVIAVTQAQRKIPVQYAQRAVGRKIFSGGTSFLPLRLNFAGVMPIIFAGAILMVPQYLFTWINAQYSATHPSLRIFGWMAAKLQEDAWVYVLVYGLLILFFSYFWTATQFNELQIADDLKKNGGYVPGVRPGQATSAYLHHAMTRITLAGAVFLVLIAIVPTILYRVVHIASQDVTNFFGGTSLLITVGVMLDTMRQMESHLMMRHYDGFLKTGRGSGPRLRGRL